MSLNLNKCLNFSNNKNIKINREIDGKTYLYSHCIGFGFKKSETIYKEKLSNLLKSLNYI